MHQQIVKHAIIGIFKCFLDKTINYEPHLCNRCLDLM